MRGAVAFAGLVTVACVGFMFHADGCLGSKRRLVQVIQAVRIRRRWRRYSGFLAPRLHFRIVVLLGPADAVAFDMNLLGLAQVPAMLALGNGPTLLLDLD